VAVTFAPVPGFRRLVRHVEPSKLHPYPWLRRPGAGSIASFSQWRRG
jgi:deoxyribodipyrimidine photo-lyase